MAPLNVLLTLFAGLDIVTDGGTLDKPTPAQNPNRERVNFGDRSPAYKESCNSVPPSLKSCPTTLPSIFIHAILPHSPTSNVSSLVFIEEKNMSQS